MTNALSLRPGDRVPDFALPGLDGKLRKFIWSFTGDPVALLAVDDLGNLDAAQFDSLMAACKASSVIPVVVAGNAVAAAAAPWAKLGGSAESPLLLCDADRKFLPALLSQGGVGLGPGGSLRMRVIVLDPNQRIAATFSRRWPVSSSSLTSAPKLPDSLRMGQSVRSSSSPRVRSRLRSAGFVRAIRRTMGDT